MKKVKRDELLDLGAYEQIRERFRAAVIEEKRNRRFSVSDELSIVFENHTTVLFQIQEMLRTERITREAPIQHELETYNELIPAPGELSATLFVEIADRDIARAAPGRAGRARGSLRARGRRPDLPRAQRDARSAARPNHRGPLREVSARRRGRRGGGCRRQEARTHPRRACACGTHTSRSPSRYRPASRTPSPKTSPTTPDPTRRGERAPRVIERARNQLRWRLRSSQVEILSHIPRSTAKNQPDRLPTIRGISDIYVDVRHSAQKKRDPRDPTQRLG